MEYVHIAKQRLIASARFTPRLMECLAHYSKCGELKARNFT